MNRAFAVVALIALIACTNSREASRRDALTAISQKTTQLGSAPTVVRRRAVFWAAQTGALAVENISGDTAVPWANPPPTHLTIVFTDARKALLFRQFSGTHRILASATINDAADGEYYTLGRLQATKYQNERSEYPPRTRAQVTFKIEVFHLKCGPPTCNTPESI